MRKYYVIVGKKVKIINGERRKKNKKKMKGKNDLIYEIFHYKAEEMQISKEVSDQKSKLVFRSI